MKTLHILFILMMKRYKSLFKVSSLPDSNMTKYSKHRQKHRLVEAYQPLITSLAKRYVARYRSFHMLDISDFVQEGSIALFQALDTVDFTAVTSFRSYCSAIIRSAFVRVHYGSDDPISMSHSSYYCVKKQGTLTTTVTSPQA